MANNDYVFRPPTLHAQLPLRGQAGGSEDYVIQPRFSLPMRVLGERKRTTEPLPVPHPPPPPLREEGRKRSWDERAYLWMKELFYLVLVGDLALAAYWYLGAWPVYRIVAFVVLAILWANAASGTIRDKTREQSLIWLSHAAATWKRKQAHEVKASLTQDTMAYLAALKVTLVQKDVRVERFESPALHIPVSRDREHRDLLHRHSPTPPR